VSEKEAEVKSKKQKVKSNDNSLCFLPFAFCSENYSHEANQIYQNAVDILTSQGKFHINLGLERIEKILELLKNPQKKLKVIHIAGTNGKGSVSAMLSSILTHNKIKTGLFTSPHIFEYTERIKINDIQIKKEIFAQKVIKITELARKNNIHLTEFEILTAVAFEYFAENKVEVVVLETGLGGRLDSTNIIKDNLCSIITHIDFDHTERLGDTIEKIAAEKAAIIKENCPVVANVDNLGIEIIKKVAKEKNSPLYLIETPEDLPECSLLGLWQKENLSLVLMAIEILSEDNFKKGFKITDKNIELGLKNVVHPCRFEYLKEKNILIDGAHNPNGAKALRESLDYYFPNQSFNFIFGCLKNKNYPQMMKNLFTAKDEINFYTFNNPNSCTYEELSNVCEFNSKQFNNFENANNKLTVVCGSFYMIKELLRLMHKPKNTKN